MTAQEPIDSHHQNEMHDNALTIELTKASEKLEDFQAESASIASALDGDFGSPIEDDDDQGNAEDLEKATTQATRTSHEPATRIVTAIDWTGPDDKDNALIWPLWKKAYHTVAIGGLAFAVTAGSSMITPATTEIAEQFRVSRGASILSLTLYVVGLGMGPIVGAPISETWGRAIVFKVSAPIFMLFILGSGFSKSLGSLLVCRLLAGITGGPVLAVGAGSIADMYPAKTRALASATFIMMPFLGPALGPVIGGFAAYFKSWRWTQWCTIFIGVAAFALVLGTSETYKKVILTKRAKKHGVPGPPTPPVKGLAYMKLLITITLVRPVHMLFTEPIVLFLSLYNSFTFSVLFAFFAAYPYTFESVYGFNTWQYGLTFLGILIGVLLAVVTAMVFDRKIYMKKHKKLHAEGKGAVAPEHRLYAAMAGAFGVPIGLFWFAWTARSSVHWISPVLAGIPFAWGNLCIFISAALYLIDVYGPLNGASAMASNGLARYTLGGVFPLFTFQMYGKLGIDWATSLLAFISVGMMAIPWVFFKFGPKIRAKSSYNSTKA